MQCSADTQLPRGSVIKPCIALVLLFCPLLAQAIELGEPQVESWLGEPLQVLVPVELGGLEPRGVRIRLLNANEYQALNLAPAPAFLSQLTAAWTETREGLHIQLASRRTNPEPLLSIALELSTPRLRVVRYVSLLFDPRPASATAPKGPTPRQTPPRQTAKPSQPRRPSTAAQTAPKPTPKAQSTAKTPPRKAPAPSPAPPRFQLSHALREIPPHRSARPILRTPYGTLSTQLAGYARADKPATSSSVLKATTATQPALNPSLKLPPKPESAAANTEPRLPPSDKALGDHTPASAVAGPPIGRLAISLLPVLLTIGLWWALQRRVRTPPQDDDTALAAWTDGATKVTAIHEGRVAPESSTPTLRAANE